MPIEIVDYREEWPELFRLESVRVRAVLKDTALRIEHVGSTAVPDLAAKDTIDIQVSVENLDDEHLFVPQLQALGYTYVPDDEPAHRFFKLKDEAGNHLFHVHVCQHGGKWERDHLLFRDHLRRHPDTARTYEELKRNLAARIQDRREYAAAKDDFIREAERAAREAG